MNLSQIDKKILFELDKDGRASFSEIARVLGSTPQVVKYHVEQLQEKGVIKHFWAFTDYDKMDYSFFWGYWLKFTGLSKEKEKEMYSYFNSNQFIPIVQRTDGYADVFIAIIAKDVFHHNEVLQDIYSKYGSYITMSDIFVGLGFIKFPRTYLTGKQNEFQKFAVSGGTTEKTKLSETDRKIVSLLLQDGRMEFTKIAKVLGVSVGLVHKHFNRLEKNGIITKTAFSINYEKAGLLLYRTALKIVQFDQKRIDALYEYCCLHPNIINYIKGMGAWELLLEIEVESREQLRDILREMKEKFRDIITRVEPNEVYQMDKFTQMAIEYPNLLKEYESKNKKDSKESTSSQEDTPQKATEEDLYY